MDASCEAFEGSLRTDGTGLFLRGALNTKPFEYRFEGRFLASRTAGARRLLVPDEDSVGSSRTDGTGLVLLGLLVCAKED